MTELRPEIMKIAIDLSRKGLGTTSPNPVVGCVIVKDGVIIGEGYHEYAGGPHAEVVALKRAGEKAEGSEVYVTLEPCSFYGRTPPCTEALKRARVKSVIVAVKDPHPKVCGNGIRALQEAGIKVYSGLLSEEAAFVNRYYLTSMIKKRPYVTVKLAATIDGYIADSKGSSKWITSERAREDVQELRRVHDAIVVGSSTYIVDKPLLTYRGSAKKIPPLKRFVLVSSRESVNAIKSFGYDSSIAFVVPESLSGSFGDGEMVVREKEGRVDISDFLVRLNENGIRSLLVEGGSRVAGSFVKEGLFDELVVYTAPKILFGGKKLFHGSLLPDLESSTKVDFHSVEVFGEDVKKTYFNPEVIFKCLPESLKR